MKSCLFSKGVITSYALPYGNSLGHGSNRVLTGPDVESFEMPTQPSMAIASFATLPC